MKHAGPEALASLAELLVGLRARIGVREKWPGIFYVKGRALLHFHEDRAGLFADLRKGEDWRRLPVNGPEDWSRLLAEVDETLARAAR